MLKIFLVLMFSFMALALAALPQDKVEQQKIVEGCALVKYHYQDEPWFISGDGTQLTSTTFSATITMANDQNNSYKVRKVVKNHRYMCIALEYGGKLCGQSKYETIGMVESSDSMQKSSKPSKETLFTTYSLWIVPRVTDDSKCMALQKKWLALF